MSLQQLAQTVQAQGRNNDTMLVHMTPGEVAGLQALAQAHGGSLSVNPSTGLPEAGFLSSILPTIVGGAVGIFTMNPWLGAAAGAAVGAATAEDGQNPWKQAALGALGGYGGASMLGASGLGAAGSAAGGAGAAQSAATVGTGAAGAVLAPASTTATTIPMTDAATYAFMGDFSAPVTQSLAASAGTGAAPALTGMQSLMPPGAEYDAIQRMYEGVGGPTQLLSPLETDAAFQTAGMTSDIPVGSTADLTSKDVLGSLSPSQRLEYGLNKTKSWWDEQSTKDKLQILGTSMQLLTPEEEAVQLARGPAVSTPGYSVNAYSPSGGGGGGFAPRWSSGKIEAPGAVRAAALQPRQAAFASRSGGFGAFPARAAQGGLLGLAEGGAVPSGGFVDEGGVVHLDDGGFVFSAPATAAVGGGSSGAGQRKLAEYGGIALNGPGDGQSDSIHALISGQQPARVADGEVYFPPQAVAKIGGGDHQKGAKRLYEAMNRAAKKKWPTASAEGA